MLKRDVVIKPKFALVEILDAIVASLTMHRGDLLPVGLPQGIPESVEKVDGCGRLITGPVRRQMCHLHRHDELLYAGCSGAGCFVV